MMKKIKGIIFDKDGTLFDIQRSWSEWAKVFVKKFSNQHNLDTLKLAKAINFDLASDKFVRESIFVHGSVDEVVDGIVIGFWDKSHDEVIEGGGGRGVGLALGPGPHMSISAAHMNGPG